MGGRGWDFEGQRRTGRNAGATGFLDRLGSGDMCGGRGRFPAGGWGASISPDSTEPELWWGKWPAENGYVVLTSWSFIRHYRDDTNYASGAAEKVYQRYGLWLGLGKMVHDARREAE